MCDRACEEFFQIGMQYYVAGRFAAFAQLNPVTANLLHHAIEMFMKGCLSKSLDLNELKQLGHNLPNIWKRLKVKANNPALDCFDKVIEELHHFEELRYPDKILTTGMSVLINIRNSPCPSAKSSPNRTEPSYKMCVQEIDELATTLFLVGSVNPAFVPLTARSRQSLLEENDYMPLKQ
jgi:hypothetical protein